MLYRMASASNRTRRFTWTFNCHHHRTDRLFPQKRLRLWNDIHLMRMTSVSILYLRWWAGADNKSVGPQAKRTSLILCISSPSGHPVPKTTYAKSTLTIQKNSPTFPLALGPGAPVVIIRDVPKSLLSNSRKSQVISVNFESLNTCLKSSHNS